jgi:hypothetical protein
MATSGYPHCLQLANDSPLNGRYLLPSPVFVIVTMDHERRDRDSG